jgi:predicted GIY-YIG superfamily endonuclease
MNDEMLRAYGRKRLDEVRYWLYRLNCRSREYDYDSLQRRAKKRFGEEPWYLRQAFEADTVYYVGQTEDIEKRLGQHFKQKNSAKFTQLFEPSGIDFLKPCSSRNQAEFKESRMVDRFKDVEGVFAYGV